MGNVWLDILMIGVLLKCLEKCLGLIVVEVIIIFKLGCFGSKFFK